MNRIYRYIVIALAISSALYVLFDMTFSKRTFVYIPPQYTLKIDRVFLSADSSLEKAIAKTKIPSADLKALFSELSKVMNIYEVANGDFIDILYDNTGNNWTALWYYPQGTQFYAVWKLNGNEFVSSSETLPVKTIIEKKSGIIEYSLNETMTDLGLTYEAFISFINLFKWDFDFFTQTQKNDYFKIVYEANILPKKNISEFKRILAAEYRGLNNKTFNAFYWAYKDSKNPYFNSDAKSVDQSYLMSPFYYPSVYTVLDKRKGQISKEIVQNIIDFSVSSETAVLAVSEGFVNMTVAVKKPTAKGAVIQNPILIKQPDGNTVYYGELSRYATEIKRNAPIKQGQIIGYTSKSLELKVIKSNDSIEDFYKIKRYPKISLRGEERNKFLDSIRELQEILRGM
ncbi:MAG: M23 family metallopeptidase [Elusimicrobiota bacterium]|jgi:hypothetical protein|nr:M23 family metallopeptidase [Elusimicrobiota bacterium]